MGFKKPFEERTTAREDKSVGFYALVFTGQSDISEVVIDSEFSKRCAQNILKIIPLQTQLLICHYEKY